LTGGIISPLFLNPKTDKKMKKIIIIFFCVISTVISGDIKGSFSTGIFMGTPFWDRESYQQYSMKSSDTTTILRDDSYIRSVNQFRLKGGFAQNKFEYSLNAMRSDGFNSDPHISNTKIYEIYLKYNLNNGYLQAGRLFAFSRWIRGSFDGGALSLALSDAISINAMGGMSVNYGKLYDRDMSQALGYGDIAFKMNRFMFKLKGLYTENISKAGVDFRGKLWKIGISGNYGYDITNKQLSDGGLNLLYSPSSKWTISGNYRLMRTALWKWTDYNFSGSLIERFLLGIRYKIHNQYYLDIRQMSSMTVNRIEYLTLVNLTGKYFNTGFNYLVGENGKKRLGIIVGGRYRTNSGLSLSAGISPVSYQYSDYYERLSTTTYYFRAAYQVLNPLQISVNFNYYQDNKALYDNIRGGLQLRYSFGS
jgi:hypothetical protein